MQNRDADCDSGGTGSGNLLIHAGVSSKEVNKNR